MQLSTATVVALLAAVGLVVGGALTRQVRVGALFVQTFTGGLLLALVAVDVLPDALSGAPRSDRPWIALVTVAVAAGTFASLRTGRDAESGSCCRRTAFGAWAIAGHGLVEGLVLGLGLGLDSAVDPLLLCAFCLHKMGEGFALVVVLRRAGSRRAVVWGWLAAAAGTPVLGAAAASFVTLPSRGTPVLIASLAGVLAAVAATMLAPIVRRPVAGSTVVRAGAGLVAGVTLMGIVTGLAG